MKQLLQQALAQRQKKRIVAAGRIPSAVLVPIYCKDGKFHILFTKRTRKVKTHKGQISFPGGSYEVSDGSLRNTALRESREEIGLKEEDVEVLGELDDFNSATTNFVISPFVGFIPSPYDFKLNEFEAAELIETPLEHLLDKHHLREETRILNGRPVTAYFYDFHGKVIWGATARILKQFLDIYTGLPGFNTCCR
ncbi:MAG: CoA pyrophosphatase [Dehalococcoidales bacterium]|nr:CoA pyrophosphatase [Dehalococcoidales bacterium]